VGLREASGRLRELFHRELGPVEDPAPPTLEIDLGAWSGAAVEILFQVDRPALAAPEDPSPFALWGSPQVWSRKEAAPSPPASLERPNVLLLGVDTLRADALGVYGRSPSTSPALDRLAEQSDVWLEAYSTFNNTNPSFASIHTGLYGKNHGIYDLVTPLPEEHTTLAELLGAVGYRTLAVIAARHLGHRTSGLGQGFDEVVSPAAGPFAAELVVDAATDWIATGPEPFYAWLHLYDPHTPHTPPQPFALGLGAGELTGLRSPRTWRSFRPLGARPYIEPLYAGHEDLYAGEVAYLDRQIDRLLDALESHGLLGRTIIAFVADHGENFGEHGLYASHVGLWETTTHVPLMIRWPGESSEGRRLGGLVQTLDLFPTLLRATGIDPPANDGRDLLELTTQGGTGRRVVMSQHANRRGISARTREWRYVSISGQIGVEEGEHLYDLTRDPRETENVAELHPERLQELADLTRRWRDDATPRTQAPQPTELSPEDIDRLKALGYLR
jgi:arylsulfatase A-like enzyme